MSGPDTPRTGGCLCGAVRYTVTGALTDVIACHCSQCRKTSGHFVAATGAPRESISIEGAEHITRYQSSPGVTREFCAICGSQLFWNSERNDTLAIFAGTLDDSSGLMLAGHIFCADKGAYYELEDGLPQAEADDSDLTTQA